MTYPEQQPSMGVAPQPPLQVVPAVQVAPQAAGPQPTPEPAQQAQKPAGPALTEQQVADGWVVVRLSTKRGEADITVPPQDDWLATARNAIFTRGDDLAWAIETLSPDDAVTWGELNPTSRESQAFLTAWGRTQGNRAARRAQGNR